MQVIARQRKTRNVRKQKNPRSKSAKISHYRLLKVLECFAADLSVKQASALTRISEKSLREHYAQIRLRMVMAALNDPEIFGGFNALITDGEGRFEPEVLALMAAYTKTGKFRERLRRLYPRTNVETRPMLFHAIEFFIRKFLAMQPPAITPEFKDEAARVSNAAATLSALFLEEPHARERIGRLYWSFARAGLGARLGRTVRRHGDKGRERLLRDLKIILLKNPL